MVQKILLLLSTCILGIFLGTQIVEAVLIVPYWKSLPSDVFFAFHKNYGKALYQFYSPLTIAATILPTCAFLNNVFNKSKINIFMWSMFIFTLLFFATYFIYFKDANISFAERTFSNEELPNKLLIWGYWHWGRVFCEMIAFICALILISKDYSTKNN